MTADQRDPQSAGRKGDKAVSLEQTALGRLAGACYDHRKRVLVLWLVLIIGISVVSGIVKGVFQDNFGGGNSESQQALHLLQSRFPAQAGDPAQVAFKTTGPVTDPANKAAITSVLDELKTAPHVVSVISPFDPDGSGLISRSDPSIAEGIIQFDKTTNDLKKKEMKPIVDRALAHNKPGFQVELGGGPIALAQTPTLGSSEGIGILAAIIILLFAFGSVIAMGLPILTALFGLAVGVGIITLMSRGLTVPTFGTELAAMIGIGVGIDYALFIVTRYRVGLSEGRDPRAAVILALATSGRAVLFAGTTVVISLFGMLLLGLPFVYGLAFGAISAVVMVMLASITLLPALLGFSGRAIDKLHMPQRKKVASDRPAFWVRWSREVQKRRWIAAISALIVLLVLAIPLLSMRLSFTDQGNDQEALTTRKAYDLLVKGFGAGANGPLVAAVQIPNGDTTTITKLQQGIAAENGVQFVNKPSFNQARDTAVLIIIPLTSPQDAKTVDLVHRLRNDVVPWAVGNTGTKVLIGGITAAAVDSAHQLSSRLIIVISGVVILSFLLLMAVFRSIAVPLKAALMNLLSIGAAYGVIVAVFQWGWLGSVIGIGRTGPIDPWVPLMLFTILFGLSMDYEVFLLSRIREEYLETGDNADAVVDGLAATARVITAAAAIMVCVFGSFVLGDIRVLKLFGLGLATAVFVDASVVRMVLVPATMELLGNANWWLPKWLDRVVPNLSVDLPVPRVEPAVDAAPAT
jgi:RND superfamily putative drug exporter